MSHLVARTAIPIDAVECSPHPASQSLIAFSAGQRITVSQWVAEVDDDDIGTGEPIAAGIRALRDIRHFHVGTRTEDISWAPTSSVDQQLIRLCLAGADFAIRILEAQLASNTYNIAAAPLEGHTGHINAVEYSPGPGEFIASVSDDQTLRIWDVGNQQQHSCFELDSAGVSVSWEHGMDASANPLQVMVAERSGLIRFFLKTGGEFTPFRTVQTDEQPLTSACLCRSNPSFISAAVNGQWALWNRQKSPLESPRAQAYGRLDADGKPRTLLRWSPHNREIFLMASADKAEIIHAEASYFDGGGPGEASGPLRTVGEVLEGHAAAASWHSIEPFCTVAIGTELHVLSNCVV